MNYDIKTTELASDGKQRIDWANRFIACFRFHP